MSDGSHRYIKVKIVDFGSMSLLSNIGKSHSATTPGYRAPEVILGLRQQYSSAVDIWSLGCICYRMLTGHRFVSDDDRSSSLGELQSISKSLGSDLSTPTFKMDSLAFPSSSELMSLYEQSMSGWKYCSDRLSLISDDCARSFVSSCLQLLPHNRLSAAELSNHPFLNNII